MESNNVVLFPPDRIAYPARSALNSDIIPGDLSTIKDTVYMMKMKKITQVLEILIPVFVNALGQIGIRASPDEASAKSNAFFIEGLKALLMQHLGLPHPMHKIAEELFEINEKGEITMANLYVRTANGEVK